MGIIPMVNGGRLMSLLNRLSAMAQVYLVERFILRRSFERIYLILGGHIYFQTLSAAVQLDLLPFLSQAGA